MTVKKNLGSGGHRAAANKNGCGSIKDSSVGMDGLSRWPRLSCHSRVGIPAILRLFVSIVGVIADRQPCLTLLVVLCVSCTFGYIGPWVQNCWHTPHLVPTSP
jgi:hypothetical protein